MKKSIIIIALVTISVISIVFFMESADSPEPVKINSTLSEELQQKTKLVMHSHENEAEAKTEAGAESPISETEHFPLTDSHGKITFHDSHDGVPVSPPLLSEEEKAQHEKLEKLGHLIPIEYYNYGLETLKQLAENGDAYASFHLGERYYYQLLNDPNHQDYDDSMDYKAAARSAFSQALHHGNRHAAAVISELNMQEENHENAYAWHLVAQDLGDTPATEWFKKQNFYQTITDEQKENALAYYRELKQSLKNQWEEDGLISLL